MEVIGGDTFEENRELIEVIRWMKENRNIGRWIRGKSSKGQDVIDVETAEEEKKNTEAIGWSKRKKRVRGMRVRGKGGDWSETGWYEKRKRLVRGYGIEEKEDID